jgi:GNAT superfamily N-acetyltransferase
MAMIEIRQITSKKKMREFLTFPWKIYRDDPLWVPPLLADRWKAVDPARGVFFQRGIAEFWGAYRRGKLVGTICTAIDHKANQNVNKKDCVFGFFECVNDRDVAFALFDHTKAWAIAHEQDSLYGPFNLDYEDGYGILVEGRDRPPVILCGHTTDYYQGLLEAYGFTPGRGDNLAFARDLHGDMAGLEEIHAFAERVRERKKYTVRHADFDHWEAEVDRVYALINPALKHLPGHVPWQPEALHELMAPFVQIANPELILFAEDEGKPVGFFPALPNFNEVLIHANGLRYPWNYLQAWWHARKPPKSAAIKSVLVLPEYWGSGVAILMFSEMAKRLLARGYDWVDLSLTSADNPKTPVLAERMGASIYKRYRVFRLRF